MKPTLPHRVARGLVRWAASTAPWNWRDRMLAEWYAELAGEARVRGGWSLTKMALGAFADARALRRLTDEREGRTTMSGWMEGWSDDLRVAVRGLLRTPGFTGVAVVTLALGMGGSAAIFAVLDRVVLDPLPYPESERLVALQNQVPGVGPGEKWALSTAQQVYFSDHVATLEAVGVFRYSGGNVVTASGPLRVDGVLVTASIMDLLGARARLGRVIAEGDDVPSVNPVAVLSHGFWTRELGGDPDVVGTTVSFNDGPVEIIGVLEPGLELPGWPARLAPDLWMPLRIDRGGEFYNSHGYRGIARLARNATPVAVEVEIEALTPRLIEVFPRAYQQSFFDRYGFRTEVTPLKANVLGDMGTNLWLLFAGVGLVLLVACANVLNLYLVRMEVRRREVAVRSALGARQSRIVRYLFAEALSLALIGGAVGLLLGYWALPALTALAPDDLPRVAGVGLGLEAVGFMLALSLMIGSGLALFPMLTRGSRAPAGELVSESRGSSVGKAGARVRGAMVVSQVALALTLTISAALLVETLRGLYATDTGFDPEGVVAMDIYLSPVRYPDDVAAWQFHRELLSRVEAIPGVASVGLGEELPVSGGFGCTIQAFEDQTVYARIAEAGMTTCAGQIQITPGYFDVLGIPVLEGRGLELGDNDDPTRGSVVVSQAFADRFWPGENPIGKGVNPSGRGREPFYRVVGVVGDVPSSAADGQIPLSQPAIAIYYPMIDNPDAGGSWGWSWTGAISLVAKAERGSPTDLVPAIRSVLRDLDPEVPVADVREAREDVAGAMTDVSFVSLLLGIAAAVALLLSAVGLYGTLSYWVRSRTREIGMRLAIGARPGDVQREVVASALRLALGGLVVGVVLALFTSGALEQLLVGVEPTEPVVYAAGAGVLALVALFASWLPAHRAASVDPAEALRAE